MGPFLLLFHLQFMSDWWQLSIGVQSICWCISVGSNQTAGVSLLGSASGSACPLGLSNSLLFSCFFLLPFLPKIRGRSFLSHHMSALGLSKKSRFFSKTSSISEEAPAGCRFVRRAQVILQPMGSRYCSLVVTLLTHTHTRTKTYAVPCSHFACVCAFQLPGTGQAVPVKPRVAREERVEDQFQVSVCWNNC